MLRNCGVLAVLMLAGATVAGACSMPNAPSTTEEKFARATAVLVARIVRTEEAAIALGDRTWSVVEGTFRTIEVLKGQAPQDQKIRSLVYGPGNCTIPILAGWNYVLFLGPGGPFIDADDKNLIWWTNGSFPAPNLEAKDIEEELEKLRELSGSQK